MQCAKFEPLSWKARLACAAFAVVSCLASVAFVIVSFASAAAGSPAAELKPEPADAMVARQRPPRPVPV